MAAKKQYQKLVVYNMPPVKDNNVLRKLINYIRIFFRGFHYAIKKYNIIEDHHFHTYTNKDSMVDNYGNVVHSIYRRGIKSGRLYFLYRYETLTFLILAMGIIVMLTF